jgi:hypothetical protein
MDVFQAIHAAEQQLPGKALSDGEIDPRWQAIIQVADFVESDPEAVWQFIERWGAAPDEDLRTAVATVLLEHLLETNFTKFFPLVAVAVRGNRLFADTFCRCWKFGQAELPDNSRRFDDLKAEVVTQ